MEHRELEEMHEGLDQALRSALQGLGSLRERQARRAQMSADQTRVAAAADRHQFEAYQQAQDAMLREQLGNVTTDKWWDTTTPQDMARTVDLAERYAGISPYANAALDNVRSEAERRGVDLTAPPRDVHQGAQVAENAAAVDRVVAAVEELPAGSDTLDDYRSTDNRRDVIDPAAHHSGPAPGREPQGQTRPPAAAQTQPYERARASDMAGADPEHVRTRLTVANAFVHPIRSYTTGRGNTASGDAAAPSRRQQLKRGK